MPEQGSIIKLIDNLALVALILMLLIQLFKKCWKQPSMLFLGINAMYNISLYLVSFMFPMHTHIYEIVSNLTIHVDTLSILGFFYFLWENDRYRKFLLFSIAPVLATWLITLLLKGPNKNYVWNLMLPSVWIFTAATYAMLLLYRNSINSEGSSFLSRFLLISGFLFYHFVYMVIETLYLAGTDGASAVDAWNINYWGYFIFRILLLGGTIAWYVKPENTQPMMAFAKK
ncbi:hypothetical protein KJS94_04195 [Flavihumibacter rivuli]|uniref:hypothetical protein n=1 Tax=Flavihumibacter rivuli TaxID=2838156 RepID=UPI001BDF6039|nr:hypothetical protein [Flavihumibacter rivuli]ULQ57401.1 hypothetical protein KJS94_04195 [Flavihumibacter rivuli]